MAEVIKGAIVIGHNYIIYVKKWKLIIECVFFIKKIGISGRYFIKLK